MQPKKALFDEGADSYLENPLIALYKESTASTGWSKYQEQVKQVKEKQIDKAFQKTCRDFDVVVFPSEKAQDHLQGPTPFQIY